ncbi:MAG: TonB-dependent receptor [Bacteroidota bacterium]
MTPKHSFRSYLLHTGLFWILCCFSHLSLHSQVSGPSPSISIQSSSIEVGQVLAEISRQAGVDFSYNSKLIDPDKRISFSVEQASLKETLDQLSKILRLRYTIIDGQVIFNALKKKDRWVNITGFLSDLASGESLIGSMVGLKELARGAFTNEFGYYSISVKPGRYTLVYAHIGYERVEKLIEIGSDIQADVALPPKSYNMPEVVIEPALKDIMNKKMLGELELNPDQLRGMPEFAGEAGLVNGLQSLPGIKTHSDGSAFFYSRGGERDQNVIIIDDAPIYNPSHLFGFYSMYIPDFAKNVKVYKSDMPAMVGDRLSSIVSIRTKDGNLNNVKLSGAINPFVYRLSLESPIVKKKSSLFMTFRRSNFEWVYRRSFPELDLNFMDIQLKLNHKINDKNRLYMTTIWGSDVLQDRSSENSRTGILWINVAASLRWNHIFGPKLFSNTTLYTGNYVNRLFLTPNYWVSGLGMGGLKSDFTHYATPSFQSRFGFDFQGYSFDPGSVSIDSAIAILPSIQPNYSRKNVVYYQARWDVRKKIRINAGVRLLNWGSRGPATYYTFDDQYEVEDTVSVGDGVFNEYVNLDPRLSVQYQLSPSSQLKLSFGRYHQYLHQVSNSTSPFTTLEVWLPATPNVQPQSSRQWSLSYLTFLPDQKLEISAAAYYKTLSNQIDYEPHAITYLNPLIEGELRFGETKSYGIEFLLKKDFGRLNGWMGYTYSRVFRQTEGLNEGRRYRAFQDRPHDFSMLIHYQIRKRLLLSTYWTSYSGSTFSSPTGFLRFNDQSVPIYGERNNDRLPAYHRMDVSLQWKLNRYDTNPFQHNLTFSINNFLAHQNIHAIKFNRIPGANASPVVQANVLSEEALRTSQVALVRFLPSITYRFTL